MDWSNPSVIANVGGGALVVIFLLWQLFQKLIESFGWFGKLRQKRTEEQQRQLEDKVTDTFNKKILPPILAEIKQVNVAQNEVLGQLQKSNNDLIRLQLNEIYYKYLPLKKIPEYDWKNVVYLHTDYAAQHGNTYENEMFEEMKSWERLKSLN